MRRFLGKTAGFAAIQLLILAVLLWRSRSTNSDEFLAASIDKHARAESIEGPRILLVGGSNVAFGIDSPELERRLSLPVVNFGLHAGVGLEFMLREASVVSRAGDLVILSPEYEQFLSDNMSPAIVLRIAEHRPESGHFLSAQAIGPFLELGLPFLHKVVRRGTRPRWRSKPKDPVKEANNPYFRDSFNIQGDVVAHHRMTPTYQAYTGPAKTFDSASEEADHRAIRKTIERLNEFTSDCRSRDVRVCFSHPVLAAGFRGRLGPNLEAIDVAVRTSLLAPVVTRLEDLTLNDSHFFDSCYHPTASGKQIRTAFLADGMERLLRDRSVPDVEISRGQDPRSTRPTVAKAPSDSRIR